MDYKNLTSESKFKALLASQTKEQLLAVIKRYNEYCKENDRKEDQLTGYSKKPYNTKDGLIDFLLERLAIEEKEGIIKNVERPYLIELFEKAKQYFNGEAPTEKLETVSFKNTLMKLKFKGWQWENETEIDLSETGEVQSSICSCKIGQMEGFCPHLATGLAILINQYKLNLEAFPFKIPSEVVLTFEALYIDLKVYEDVDKTTADIVLGDDYFISVEGSLVTMKWEGERAGKSMKDISEEAKPIDPKAWVAKKVVDKLIGPLKHHQHPREIFKDDYGVVPEILANEKLVEKLIKKFSQKNEESGTNLPITKKDLAQFLMQHL